MTNQNKQPIRVWALFRHYYPNFAGGAIQSHRILSTLANQGFSVNVLAAADHQAANLAGQSAELDGLTIHYVPVIHRRNWKMLAKLSFLHKLVTALNVFVSNQSLSIRNAWILWRKGQRGDIVQLYAYQEFSFLVISVAQAKDMHVIVRMSLAGSDDPSAIKKRRLGILNSLRSIVFRRAGTVISISSALTASCQSAGIDVAKIERIPNGVDMQKFHPVARPKRASLRLKLGLETDRRYIVFVGSAKRRKGIDVLIHSFIQVARQVNDVDLLVIGPNDFQDLTRHKATRKQLVAELNQDIASANLTSRIHWVGKIDNVYQYLQVSDIFCFPSRREGLPNAVAEAMAVGLPIVASRLEGITTDLIHSEAEGILIEGHQPDDYAAALLQLLANISLANKLGNSAHTRIKTDFSLDIAIQRYIQLYGRLSGSTNA